MGQERLARLLLGWREGFSLSLSGKQGITGSGSSVAQLSVSSIGFFLLMMHVSVTHEPVSTELFHVFLPYLYHNGE